MMHADTPIMQGATPRWGARRPPLQQISGGDGQTLASALGAHARQDAHIIPRWTAARPGRGVRRGDGPVLRDGGEQQHRRLHRCVGRYPGGGHHAHVHRPPTRCGACARVELRVRREPAACPRGKQRDRPRGRHSRRSAAQARLGVDHPCGKQHRTHWRRRRYHAAVPDAGPRGAAATLPRHGLGAGRRATRPPAAPAAPGAPRRAAEHVAGRVHHAPAARLGEARGAAVRAHADLPWPALGRARAERAAAKGGRRLGAGHRLWHGQ